jgi:hypothetical protein
MSLARVRAGSRDITINGRIIRIGRLDGEKYRFLDDPEPLLRDLRTSRPRPDLFTFLQRLPDTQPRFSYHMEWDNLAVLELSSFEHWWNVRLGNKTRNMVRHAAKRGVTVKEVPHTDSFVQGVSHIYNECPVRQGRAFPHYRKPVDIVRQELATFTESSVFIAAHVDGDLIGFAKLTLDEHRRQAGLMHILAMTCHRDKAPTNALMAEAVRACAQRDVPFLVYSNFAYGNKQRDSLSDFKERNGFRRIDLPRYYVPLSWLGSLSLKLGMHRRLIDYLPAELLSTARHLRNGWHSWRVRTSH